jgi:hypothetical protein
VENDVGDLPDDSQNPAAGGEVVRSGEHSSISA